MYILMQPHALTHLSTHFCFSPKFQSDLDLTLTSTGGVCFSLSPFSLMHYRRKLGDNSVAQAIFQVIAKVFSGLVAV